ncbi:MAG TPA: FkbM family methyltransferase [Phycisphaerae bacterium]|nr:FkbM family methyltransferase [Phycisphaerae bacterium]HUT59456.1 FkbM family methyltransferase [Phycisphaerae bacterium]
MLRPFSRSLKGFLGTLRKKSGIGDLWYNEVVLDPGAAVVEIGALSGNIALHACKAFGVSAVYAVEALPSSYDVLLDNCKGSPVKTINLAVGEKNGQIEFYECEHSSSSGLFRTDSGTRSARDPLSMRKTRVPCVTLTTLMKEHGIGTVDLLIMNCEGAEKFIFPEIARSRDLAAAIRQISVELHPKILGQPIVLELIRLMYPRYDYRVITRGIRGPINVVFTRRTQPVCGSPPLFILRYWCASVLELLWPAMKLLRKGIRKVLPHGQSYRPASLGRT